MTARPAQRRYTEAGQPLTNREREILRLMADGLIPADIGQRLHTARSTITTHSQRAYRKLGVHTAPAAVAAAIRTGQIQ